VTGPGFDVVGVGGLTVSDVPLFLDGGARVVALGSALADPDQLDRIGHLLHP